MTEISHSGCKLLLARRMFVAMASSMMAQFIFTSCVILIMNVSITHPLYWLRNTWSIVTCLRMWCYFIVLSVLTLLQGVISSKNYVTVQSYSKSRFDALRGMFTPHNFTVGNLHVAAGIVLVRLHLSLENGRYGSLTENCKTIHGYCLVEEHYFLLLCGLWTGLYYFFKTNFRGIVYLEFPPIPISKYVQVSRSINAILPTAMMEALWPVFYLTGLYYFFGSYLREIIASTLFLRFEGEPLDRLSRLLDPYLLVRAWLYSALFVVTLKTVNLMFRACLTEWIPFDTDQKQRFDEDQRSVALTEAMSMEKIPIMQHLGYLDLVTIAQKDKIRRARIFALSQPGGHPYNWNCIVEKCLDIMKKFTEEVENVCSTKQEEAQIVVDCLDKHYSYHMRNLIDVRCNDVKNALETNKQSQESVTVDYLRYERDNFVSYLLSKPFVSYFFGQRNDGKIRHILANGQTVIWAAEAISSLVVASLEEDSYGIVQKDFKNVVETLFHLKQSIDKLQKTNILVRKSQNDDKTVRIVLTSLRMAVKRSIYRIVKSFKSYFSNIFFDLTVLSKLNSYSTYKE